MAAFEGTGCIGIGRAKEGGGLVKVEFERPPCGDEDVKVQIEYCGMCHSDIHTIKNEWGKTPGIPSPLCCPGHEIIGEVVEIGSAVDKFHLGQTVGVGVMVGSCGACKICLEGHEQHCPHRIWTYNSAAPNLFTTIGTQGGYSEHIVVNQKFVFTIPGNLSKPGVAPLLCAGVTTYSPLKMCHVKPGSKVLVAGLGGLGNTACKIAKAMGAEVSIISRDHSKQAKAESLGVDLIVSGDAEEMKAKADTFDVCLDTIPFSHDLSAFIHLLRTGGHMVLLGVIKETVPIQPMELIQKKISIHGSLIGGVKETQEMLEFCGKHRIEADHEVIPAGRVEWAAEQLAKGAVDHRFVIDNSTLKDL